jgi:O-antigen ligase
VELTPIGWVCIALGLSCLNNVPRLAWLLSFSTVFSATAVFNFPSIPFGFQPYHWFGVLLVASPILFGRRGGESSPVEQPGQVELLAAFIAWGVVATVVSGAGTSGFVHVVHILFGLMVLVGLMTHVRSEAHLRALVSAMVGGALAASLWGFVQFALFVVGIEYPAMLFNNSVGDSAARFESTVAGGLLPRVSSVATEPSYLVRSLVPACAVLVVLLTLEPARLGLPRRLGVASAWSMVAVTLLSTSTLGLGGLALMLAWLMLVLPPARAVVTKASLVALALLFLLFTSEPVLADVLEEVLFGKMELGSGQERADSITDAFDVFAASPIFGGGPGITTSHDLVIKLLSNFGLVGALLFAATLLSTLAQAWRAHRRAALVTALGLANAILWFMDIGAGVSYQYGVFWLLLALLLSALRSDMLPELERSFVEGQQS